MSYAQTFKNHISVVTNLILLLIRITSILVTETVKGYRNSPICYETNPIFSECVFLQCPCTLIGWRA